MEGRWLVSGPLRMLYVCELGREVRILLSWHAKRWGIYGVQLDKWRSCGSSVGALHGVRKRLRHESRSQSLSCGSPLYHNRFHSNIMMRSDSIHAL